ncbi:MAG: TPM domain-containing protein [Verrucomicrobia bacterium]|nr:TPM domain-containing protein [Verrucomicrobiota bacterium]
MSLFSSSAGLDSPGIVAALAAAERQTSGEILVVVSREKIADPVDEALRQFELLGLTRRQGRNGVLILFAPRSRTFAVIGDEGVHEKCGALFWEDLAAAMNDHFRRDDYTAGLVHGIERVGAMLAEACPR